jgi:hypothetical protein
VVDAEVVSTPRKEDGRTASYAQAESASSKSMSANTKTAITAMGRERWKMKHSAPSAKEKDTSPLVWIVRQHGLFIYKDAELIGIIPTKNFPLLISDMALKLDN